MQIVKNLIKMSKLATKRLIYPCITHHIKRTVLIGEQKKSAKMPDWLKDA